MGVVYGILSSLFVALNAIYTQRTLSAVGDNVIRLTMCVIFILIVSVLFCFGY